MEKEAQQDEAREVGGDEQEGFIITALGDGTVGSSKRKDGLFPDVEEGCSREERVKRIKRMIQENDYITDEKLDSALAKLLDEIDQE